MFFTSQRWGHDGGQLMTSTVVLVGAGGLAKEVITSLTEISGIRVGGVVDDDPTIVGTRLLGVDVLGPVEMAAALPSATRIVVCLGQGSARARLVSRLAALGVTEERYLTVVHPSVTLPASCRLGRGSIVLAQVVMTADVSVGHHVVVMPNVTLTHDDAVQDYATICAGVSLGGTVLVGQAAYIGMNASVHQNVRIGAHAVLGMGSVLLQDQPEAETWAGVPARQIRRDAATATPILRPLERSGADRVNTGKRP
jgi:sugar O-acyltransferase (sialic acid O-acetyltransferase NeuD family)